MFCRLLCRKVKYQTNSDGNFCGYDLLNSIKPALLWTDLSFVFVRSYKTQQIYRKKRPATLFLNVYCFHVIILFFRIKGLKQVIEVYIFLHIGKKSR